MVLSKNMQKLVAGSSTIRKLFEEGIELAKEVGAENVYDFSLGNPAAPVPEEVKKSIYDILENRNANFVHCYMPNAGYPEVREKVAANLNKKYNSSFTKDDIIMTVGAAGGINCDAACRYGRSQLRRFSECPLVFSPCRNVIF